MNMIDAFCSHFEWSVTPKWIYWSSISRNIWK